MDNKNTDLRYAEAAAPTHVPIAIRLTKVTRAAWSVVALASLALYVFVSITQYNNVIGTLPASPTVLADAGSWFTAERYRFSILFSEAIFVLGFMVAGIFLYIKNKNEVSNIATSLVYITFAPALLYSMENVHTLPFGQWDEAVRLARATGWFFFILSLFVFPDGNFWPRWVKWLGWVWFSWLAGWFLLTNFPISPTHHVTVFNNSYLAIVYFIWFTVGLTTLVIRYQKHATNTQRQQTKWVLYGWAILIAVKITIVALISAVPSFASETPTGLVVQAIGNILAALGALAAPITMIRSKNRNRLWTIDFLINKTLIYCFTALSLAAIYYAVITLSGILFASIEEHAQITMIYSIAAIISTAAFRPIRKRLTLFIDARYGISINTKRDNWTSKKYSPTLSIDKYKIEKVIGRGGMAEVYRARDMDNGQAVAIKVLSPLLAEHVDFRNRFAREAETIATLQHPNIVRLIDYGNINELYYIVTAYIPGKDLFALLQKTPILEIDLALDIIREIASALDFAHTKGFVHRDIKPSNVILDPSNKNEGAQQYHPVLTDFGIVKIVASDHTKITKTGVIGSFDYIAPEQIQKTSGVDSRADVYSLGIMTYQMLTGKLPFPNANPSETLMAHLKQPPENPRRHRDEIGNPIATAILKAMQKSPDKRFNTAGDFANALFD